MSILIILGVVAFANFVAAPIAEKVGSDPDTGKMWVYLIAFAAMVAEAANAGAFS